MRALLAVWLLGQVASGGTLRVTVVDQTGAVVVGAVVSIAGAEAQTNAALVPDVSTDGTGVAVFTALKPGLYTMSAAFPGFDTRVISGVRVRSGENRQVAVLTIQRVQADVTVALDPQQSASDRRGAAFGSTLTRDQIEALSDDPAVLQQQLQDMAGPGAVIRIDGFEGGPLPPKAMIRSIRISRDQFAAEFHSAGGVSSSNAPAQPVRQWPGGLRGHVGSDAARGLFAEPVHTAQHGDRRIRRAGARVRHGQHRSHRTPAALGTTGATSLLAVARAADVVGQRGPVGPRGRHHPRAGCLHVGRRAARRRRPRPDRQSRLGPRLCPGPALDARRSGARQHLVSIGFGEQLPRHLHVQHPRRLSRGDAEQLLAPCGRPGDRLPHGAGRHVPPG